MPAYDNAPSDLDVFIAARTQENPAFPALVQAALSRRTLLHALAARRVERGLTQRAVAARMGTSQAAVDRLEAGDANVTIGTLERFAAAVDAEIHWAIHPNQSDGARADSKSDE